MNSSKHLNKIKGKENIYSYIHIIKNVMRKVIKRQVTEVFLQQLPDTSEWYPGTKK